MRLVSKNRAPGRKRDDLRRHVEADLDVSNFARLRRVSVEVERDVVTLRGSVSSFYERQIAVALAEQVPGVTRVVDKLNVSNVG